MRRDDRRRGGKPAVFSRFRRMPFARRLVRRLYGRAPAREAI
jgi:ribosomal protein S18 acetylase RimI-like enzyme